MAAPIFKQVVEKLVVLMGIPPDLAQTQNNWTMRFMLTLADVIEALTNIRPAQASTVITEAAVDSRQVIPGGLFVALPGERVDGHDFVAEAFQRGASFALIQHEISGAFRTIDLRAGPEAVLLARYGDADLPAGREYASRHCSKLPASGAANWICVWSASPAV